MRIVVVGAGIVGLSVAFAVARRGAAVTLLDQGAIPNPRSASYDHNRMLRVQYGPQSGYAARISEAIDAWQALERICETQFFAPAGAVVWPGNSETWTRASEHVLATLRVETRTMSPMEWPMVEPDRLGMGVFSPLGGVLFAGHAVAMLAGQLEAMGARLLPRERVREIDPASSRVIAESGLTIDGDWVIVATGAWTAHAPWAATLSLTSIRSIGVYVQPPPALADAWRRAPCLMVETATSMLYAIPPRGSAPLKLAGAPLLDPESPDTRRPVSGEEVDTVLASFAPYLRDLDAYRPIGTAMGYYADGPDKAFVIERTGRSILISGCGGRMFKFAPALAQDVAGAVFEDGGDDALIRWTVPVGPGP